MLFQYTTSQHNYYAHGAVDIHVWYHTRDITHNASFLCLSMLCNIMSILCGIISYTVRTVSHAMMDNGHDICDMDDDNIISNVTYHLCMICTKLGFNIILWCQWECACVISPMWYHTWSPYYSYRGNMFYRYDNGIHDMYRDNYLNIIYMLIFMICNISSLMLWVVILQYYMLWSALICTVMYCYKLWYIRLHTLLLFSYEWRSM